MAHSNFEVFPVGQEVIFTNKIGVVKRHTNTQIIVEFEEDFYDKNEHRFRADTLTCIGLYKDAYYPPVLEVYDDLMRAKIDYSKKLAERYSIYSRVEEAWKKFHWDLRLAHDSLSTLKTDEERIEESKKRFFEIVDKAMLDVYEVSYDIVENQERMKKLKNKNSSPTQ